MVEIAKNAIKEKVVRVLVGTFKVRLSFFSVTFAYWTLTICPQNMIVKAGSSTIVSLLNHRVFQLSETLLIRKWSDTEITEDLDFIKDELGKSMFNLTTFDVYEAEVKSEKLEWSPPHLSDAFWKSNATRLNESDHALLRLLAELVNVSTDPVTLAVAASDIGQYVKFYPNGKK